MTKAGSASDGVVSRPKGELADEEEEEDSGPVGSEGEEGVDGGPRSSGPPVPVSFPIVEALLPVKATPHVEKRRVEKSLASGE